MRGGLRIDLAFCAAVALALIAAQASGAARRARRSRSTPRSSWRRTSPAASTTRSSRSSGAVMRTRSGASSSSMRSLPGRMPQSPSLTSMGGDGEERVVVDWAVIFNEAEARAFVAAMIAAPRSFIGRTAIGAAIDFSFAPFAESAFETSRRVIDVSGDGTSNQGHL